MTTRLARCAEQTAVAIRGTARLAVPGLLLLLVAPSVVAAQEGGISAAGWMGFNGGSALAADEIAALGVVNTMMMSFIAFGFAGVLWAVVGYSLAFGEGNSFIGDLSMAMLSGVGSQPNGTIPDMLFMAFQGTFYIITAALISGAVVGRMKFGAYVAFISLWGVLVYAPICHWVWGGGWIGSLDLPALDFAGGAVVHVNAGAAALAAALVLGTRSEYGRQAMLPHNVPFVLLGAGILWFGWMGFNGGSALAADEIAALGVVNTMLAPAGTVVVWAIMDQIFAKQITAVGAATAIVVGLVAVTPAAGFVTPMAAIAIGAIAAFPSFFLIRWRAGTSFDDSLDVFAAHGVGGASGAILTGVFATVGAEGLIAGNPAQVGVQAITILAVFAYSAILSVVILKVVGALFGGLRPTAELELRGMDLISHGEEGYATGDGAVLILDEELNGGSTASAA
jgi:Amt family ammonium transporter